MYHTMYHMIRILVTPSLRTLSVTYTKRLSKRYASQANSVELVIGFQTTSETSVMYGVRVKH